MKLKGDVINSSLENRDLVGKDGKTRKAVIAHVLLICRPDGKGDSAEAPEVVNLRCYDPAWSIPTIGTKGWETPRVKKYENFDGNVADVMC